MRWLATILIECVAICAGYQDFIYVDTQGGNFSQFVVYLEIFLIMATTSFLLEEFTGSDAQVLVTLEDVVDGTVRVTLEVVNGTLADEVGFFANFNDNFTVTEDLVISTVSSSPGTFSGTSETSPGFGILFLDDSGSTTDNVTDVANNVNLNGQGDQLDFELGVQFGGGGLQGGNDDFQTVVFELSADGLDVSDFETVGVRLQSVAEGDDGSREGSSKLVGDVPPPEPELGSIGDTVFLDTNGNGVQDLGELGIGGVTVQLINKDDNSVIDTTTDADGMYLFDDLVAGDYAVVITDDFGALVGLTQTADPDGTINPDGTLDGMSMLTLAAGENNLDQDFGYQEDPVVPDKFSVDFFESYIYVLGSEPSSSTDSTYLLEEPLVSGSTSSSDDTGLAYVDQTTETTSSSSEPVVYDYSSNLAQFYASLG